MIAILLAFAFSSAPLAQRASGDAATFAAALGTDYRVASNITYQTASGMDLTLDVYSPRATGPVPTVLFFHGGGYRLASKKENSVLSLLPYVQMGWNAVNVEYRPSNVALAPAAIEDARCAVRWAMQNAKEYNVDTGRIYIHGQNPSGSGALHLAAKYPDKFAAIVVSSGPVPTNMYPWDRIKGKMALLVMA